MAQCCYKTHMENSQTFLKIDAVSTSQLLRRNTIGISGWDSEKVNQWDWIDKKNNSHPLKVSAGSMWVL